MQQLQVPSITREGRLVTYSRDRLQGHLFQPSVPGQPNILILPPKTKNPPSSHDLVLGASIDPDSESIDASRGHWLKVPLTDVVASTPNPQELIARILSSWVGAFHYVQEDSTSGMRGLRSPQIGALHAIHAHWSICRRTATIVMPTGTGKTDTMIAILVSARCARLLVIVPTDALRTQIADKFLTLGVLKSLGGTLLDEKAIYPIVCRLEHLPKITTEVDEVFGRAQVVVTTSSIAGQCSPNVQQRIAHHCSHLFIDEAHHAEAPTWKAFKEHFKDKSVVQFTATPFREDGQPLDGDIIYQYPLKKAQEDGYFRPIHFDPVLEFDATHADQRIAEKAIARLREDLPKGHILMARVDSVARAREVFEIYSKFPEFNPIQIHTGIKSQRVRDEAKESILSGRSRIVVCVDMLGEGFDLPQLKIAAFHDIRKSLSVTLQLAGRFTRAQANLGNATFIANVADVNVREELRKLYTREPDWNALLPELSEQMIGEETSFQEYLRDFGVLPVEIALRAIRPATSAVVYRTNCDQWFPERFLIGVPAANTCEKVHHSINHLKNSLIVVTVRRAPLPWTDAENLSTWDWELFIAVWSSDQRLLFINGSSNAGDYRQLASAITGDQATLIRGQDVFRSFAGVKRLRLQNVGLTEHIGRNVRYTGRMGSDVGSRLTQAVRGNTQRSVLAGSGFENGKSTTIGASRKGRIWSQQRVRLDQFNLWCRRIGAKLIDLSIDPDEVLKGTLEPVIVRERPDKIPIGIDWPELIYTEAESSWLLSFGDRDYSISDLSIRLVRPARHNPLRFEVVSDVERVEFELELAAGTEEQQCRFRRLGDTSVSIKKGARAAGRSLSEFFENNAPKIWFGDGSSLEGDELIELKAPLIPYSKERILAWDWAGINIRKESQRDNRDQDSIQARVIRELMLRDYDVVFDDDSSGEVADIVCIRLIGTVTAPTRIEVDLFHCKFSLDAQPGARIDDLYDVCGQAQKCISWTSPIKTTDLLTHLMRRESKRINGGRPTRFERGSLQLLDTMRVISRMYPVQLTVSIVQPGLSRARCTDDQLQLLGVTENHLMEMCQVPFQVIASS
jgi:superfamily II DNA or RNA helicase